MAKKSIKELSAVDYIIKSEKARDKKLKYDFMPSMLEIIEKPANRIGEIIIYAVISLVIIAVIWACLSRVDVVITASGTIMPEGKLNVVQSYSGGQVVEIIVTEGDYVEKGDTLIVLDTDSIDIEIEKLEQQKKILETERQLYGKILNHVNLEYISTADYDLEVINAVNSIVNSDISYHSKLDVLRGEKETAELNLEIANIQLEEYRINGTSRQRESQELQIEQYELAVSQAETNIKDAKTQYITQVNGNIIDIDNQLSEINANLKEYQLTIDNQNITAPVSGYINSVEINTIGQTVTQAQQLVTIVPDDCILEMDCYVKNMDIGDVEIGMEAEIKLESYPYNRYGTVKGTVTYISPSAFVNEDMGSVYLVKISLDDYSDNINIISGMTGSVEIKTMDRSVMEYFLDPIIKGLGNSLKEK